MRGRGLILGAASMIAAAASLMPSAAADASPPAAATQPNSPVRIALVEHGHRLSASELRSGARVLAAQVNRQLRPAWPGPPVQLRVMRSPAPPGWPVLRLVDWRAPRHTAGEHDTFAGRNSATVYLRKWPHNWTVGASHELLEMLVDPAGDSISNDLLEEICDPVAFVWYRLEGRYVADFVTPAWFTAGSGPWDAGGFLRGARTFAPGGEEDAHVNGRWVWIGPGAGARRYPKPVELGPLKPSR